MKKYIHYGISVLVQITYSESLSNEQEHPISVPCGPQVRNYLVAALICDVRYISVLMKALSATANIQLPGV